MAFFKRHSKQKPESHHSMPLRESELRTSALSDQKIEGLKKLAKQEFGNERKAKAESDELKKFKAGYSSRQKEKELLVKNIQLEQKAIEKFESYMKEEISKQKKKILPVSAILKILEKLGIVWDAKKKRFKFNAKNIISREFYIFHPFGFLQDLLAIVMHKPNFLITRKMQKNFEEKLDKRKKVLEKMVVEDLRKLK